MIVKMNALNYSKQLLITVKTADCSVIIFLFLIHVLILLLQTLELRLLRDLSSIDKVIYGQNR